MACLQIARSGFTPAIQIRPNLSVRRRAVTPLAVPVHSRLEKGNGDSNGEEPPESLFMKELKRRGVTPSSLLEDTERAFYRQGQEDVAAEEENGGRRGWSKRNGVASAEYKKRASGQRELSMSLNSEGIEGLFPRAKLLLTIGGTFFLGFWPLILITVSAFAALYFYFGPTFVHDASKISASPPPYIEPYELLKDERISEIAPNVK
ncbi:hypothetical protein KFK09_027596 [Dendrobium nobile]|uniref:Tubulin alpha-6 chain n=1 Tax=Dendrobium nobile TaxID=94219 RepID=A0A8T3AB11_DENNO|nr:hypothetical protein KFK09_027596 [Dendrobium nobile]